MQVLRRRACLVETVQPWDDTLLYLAEVDESGLLRDAR
jgi:hypothetical protein